MLRMALIHATLGFDSFARQRGSYLSWYVIVSHCLECGVWCLVFDALCLEFRVWCLVFGGDLM